MKRVFFLVAYLLTATSLLAAVETVTVSVYFDTDRDELTPGAQVLLRSLFEQFNPHDDLRVTVSGHADRRGSDAYNMALAERRCYSVRSFIDALPLNLTELAVDAYGERLPLAAGMSDQALALNRRVEVTVERVFFESLEAFFEESREEHRHVFSISANEANTLTCKNGSTVSIPANALLTADGVPYHGQAQVEIVEALDVNSFFVNKLSTVSGDVPLVSGGMLRILAFSEQNEPLMFDETQRMEATVPTNRVDPNMTLFVSEDGADWDNTRRSTNLWSTNNDLMIDYTIPDSCSCPGMEVVRNSHKNMRGPRKPSQPIRPVEPIHSVVDNDVSEFQWWQWKARRLAQERVIRSQQLYDKAYERRIARYERQLTRFYADSISYPDRLNVWYIASAEFDRVIDSLYCHFVEVILHEAIVNHRNVNAACFEKRNACIQTIHAQADSLRERLVNFDSSPVQNYTMELNDFGWINIDRFMYEGAKLPTLVLEVAKPAEDIFPSMVVVFKNERGLMHMNYNIAAERYRVRIPKNVSAEIVSCYVHNDRLYTASVPFDGRERMTLEYAPSTPEAFADLVNSFADSGSTALR